MNLKTKNLKVRTKEVQLHRISGGDAFILELPAYEDDPDVIVINGTVYFKEDYVGVKYREVKYVHVEPLDSGQSVVHSRIVGDVEQHTYHDDNDDTNDQPGV